MKNLICISLILLNVFFNSCKRTNCHNGIRDGDETGIDCGGSCLECPPSVFTFPASSIQVTSANVSMECNHSTGVTNSSSKLKLVGICYSTTHNPTKDQAYIYGAASGTTGSFSGSITALIPNTIYYVRGFATNNAATAYGNEVSFTTDSVGIIVTTNSITSIPPTSATSGGNITSAPGVTVTVTGRGICYGTSTNPTTAGSTIASGAGAGSFIVNMSGLLASTTYYVRAYATSVYGTIYGNELTFLCGTPGLPTISTTSATSITYITATSGGNISNGGGATVTSRGICYNTTGSPTISSSNVPSGSGTGIFTSNLSTLTAGTTYYVRAYATNSTGTAYGNQITFTSAAYTIPTLTTNAITSITSTTATGGGNVISGGGTAVTSRGICYSSSPNPTTANNVILSGTGTGSFNSNMSSLTGGTTYYVRAFAINSVGTAYGNQVSFLCPFSLGQNYQGGVIAYIDGSGVHGIIAAPFDQSVNQNYVTNWWNGANTTTGATGTAIGVGQTNTNTIILNQGNTGSYAAKICQDLILGGYSNWYLPSRFELNQLYINSSLIGGFTSSNYWTSSEATQSTATVIQFFSGTASNVFKSSSCRVRAVRTF